MLVFKLCCSLQLRENNELGVNPSKNVAAVLDLSWRDMLLPISVNLCYPDLDHEVSIRITLLSCILLSEICYFLYQRTCAVLNQTMRHTVVFAVLYKCWKNCWMNPHVTLPNLFSIHIIPFFFSCKYQHLCCLKRYQFLVIHEWLSAFSKQFVSLLLDSVFLTGH